MFFAQAASASSIMGRENIFIGTRGLIRVWRRIIWLGQCCCLWLKEPFAMASTITISGFEREGGCRVYRRNSVAIWHAHRSSPSREGKASVLLRRPGPYWIDPQLAANPFLRFDGKHLPEGGAALND